MPEWWNGIHNWFRTSRPQGLGGSSPLFGTKYNAPGVGYAAEPSKLSLLGSNPSRGAKQWVSWWNIVYAMPAGLSQRVPAGADHFGICDRFRRFDSFLTHPNQGCEKRWRCRFKPCQFACSRERSVNRSPMLVKTSTIFSYLTKQWGYSSMVELPALNR